MDFAIDLACRLFVSVPNELGFGLGVPWQIIEDLF